MTINFYTLITIVKITFCLLGIIYLYSKNKKVNIESKHECIMAYFDPESIESTTITIVQIRNIEDNSIAPKDLLSFSQITFKLPQKFSLHNIYQCKIIPFNKKELICLNDISPKILFVFLMFKAKKSNITLCIRHILSLYINIFLHRTRLFIILLFYIIKDELKNSNNIKIKYNIGEY